MNTNLARKNMITQQIRPSEVLDKRVLDLFYRVPREAFVPEKYASLAFADTMLPCGHNEVMMTPTLEAQFLQSLALQKTEQVLEIGTGTGYLTALLALSAKSVVSIEQHIDLAAGAKQQLSQYGADNATIETANLFANWHTEKCFDAIAVTGSVPTLNVLHDLLQNNLAPAGRMFVVVGESPVMEAQLLTKIGEDQYATTMLFETVLPPLTGATKTKQFKL